MDQRAGALLALAIFLLLLFWGLRFGEIPGEGQSFTREDHPALYWPLIALFGFGVIAAIAALFGIGV